MLILMKVIHRNEYMLITQEQAIHGSLKCVVNCLVHLALDNSQLQLLFKEFSAQYGGEESFHLRREFASALNLARAS